VAAGAVGKEGTSRARGLELLRQVYAELHRCLGDEHSPAELLRAAQALIDVSNAEYSSKSFQDGIHHPGYYSHPVDAMISEYPWILLENELRCDNLTDERLECSPNVLRRLKYFYNPDRYYHRG
jgi:hypothetical protein